MNVPIYRDWAITCAFYAALHLVEACFVTQREIGSSKYARDRKRNESQHEYRQRKVEELAPRAARPYKHLFFACHQVRYSTKPNSSLARDYYTDTDVQQFLDQDLPRIRTELASAFSIRLD